MIIFKFLSRFSENISTYRGSLSQEKLTFILKLLVASQALSLNRRTHLNIGCIS